MGYYICEYGHINKSVDLIESQQAEGSGCWRCLTCGGKLETSPGIEALCTRYETRTFKVVECEFEEHTIKVEHGVVVKGPIEGALIVVLPQEQMQSMISHQGSITRFATAATETIKKAGWDGEVMFISDDMKLARFEVDER